jgi:D-alanyl-D-alanine carboxypeptidase
MPKGTDQLRKLWDEFECNPAAMVVVDFGPDRIRIARGSEEAWRALATVLKAHQYHVRLDDTDSYCCRDIKGGAGKSLHSYGIALDVNWHTNPFKPGKTGAVRFSAKPTQAERGQDVKHGKADTDMTQAMIDDVKQIRTKDGLQVFEWGGSWSNLKDAMHFELDVSPAELNAGIDWSTVKKPEDDDDNDLGLLSEVDPSGQMEISVQSTVQSTVFAPAASQAMSQEELVRIVIAELAKQSAANAPVAQPQTPPPDPLRMVLDAFMGRATPGVAGGPVLSPVDKMLGGEMLAGKKTPLAILAAAALGVLQSIDVVGMPMGNSWSKTGETLTTLIAGFGGLGLLSKVDRVVQVLGQMAKK